MRFFRIILGLTVILASLPSFAARITTIDGLEATIRRGKPARTPRIAANATRRIGANAIINVSAGADTDAANNDYRRIQDAINSAISGDSIILSGTFDFTAPFAAAAWALGNDNTAATADDYSIDVPANLNDITFTANSLGDATIQGPGDLPTVDLEAFLIFNGGDNQNWTISNLQIFDFDLSIGMFFGAGGSDAFNDTTIQNNVIRLAQDLNPTAAPADALQNIGIHYAFGTNQTIANNTIRFLGDGVSAGATFSSEVGMQSNTSGGAVYDGLSITGNTLEVLNAQSAFPQAILGIWENAHGHTSDISIANNSFVNLAPGNDSSLNLQRAFRVTSHSSAGTTVEYANNSMDGVSIGFQWLAASNFAGNQAVILRENTITGSDTGVLIQSNGIAHLTHNVITGSGAGGGIHVVTGMLTGAGAQSEGVYRTIVSGGTGDGIWIEAGAGAISPIAQNDLGGNTGFGLRNDAAAAITAERNWWGNNLAASVAAEVSGNVDFDPWLASGTDLAVALGFQPFLHATTTGAITTLLGTGAVDTAAILAGDPVTMIMNGETAFTALAQLLNFDVQLLAGDDTLTLGVTGVPTVLDMGTGTDDLLNGPNSPITYNITGANSGTAPGIANTFTGLEHIVAGTAADSFVFGAAGTLGGGLNGNLAVDTLDVSAVPAVVVNVTGPGTLDGVMGTATPIGAGFDNINLIVGSPANLSVAKSGPTSVNAGAPISYTIDVTNSGPNVAVDVTLTDVLPAGTTFASLASPAGWTCSTPAVGAGGTVTCDRTTMAVGTESFTLVVNAPLATGSVMNTAVVTSANEGAAGDEASTSNTTLLGIADLSITKTGPEDVAQGMAFAYQITVTNNGPLAATNVTVTDTLPAGVTFDSVTPSQGSCSGTSTVTCNLGNLANGASATITLNVDVTASSGTVVNTATVTADEVDTVSPNNSSTTTANATANVPIPSLSFLGLLALAAILGAVAVLKMR